jgi:hypothetical protein
MKKVDSNMNDTGSEKSNNALYDVQNGSGTVMLAIIKARKAAKGGKGV